MSRLHHLRLWATPALLAIVIGLSIAYLYKRGTLSLEWLQANSDAVAALSSLVSAATVLIAGILAYVRFFRGRTLVRRAEVSLDVEVFETASDRLFHHLTVTVKNIGTVALVNPRLLVYIEAKHADGNVVSSRVGFDEWYEVSDVEDSDRRRVALVDSGENADFSTERSFDSQVWAVTYVAVVDVGALRWSKHKIVKNSVP